MLILSINVYICYFFFPYYTTYAFETWIYNFLLKSVFSPVSQGLIFFFKLVLTYKEYLYKGPIGLEKNGFPGL